VGCAISGPEHVSCPPIKIGYQAHEAFVLMVLVMTVQHAGTRIVGDKIEQEAPFELS
jgi:hypothetical protein